MSLQIINTGSYANDGTGDPLQTSFNKVNTNFVNLTTPSSSGINGNVDLYANSITVIGSVVGNVTGNITGNLTGTASTATIATTAIYATTAGSVSGTGNVSIGNVTATGSVTIANSFTAGGNTSVGYQIANLSVSTSIALYSNVRTVIVDSTNGATIASATLTFPANTTVSNGQMLTVTSNCNVTTLTATAGSGTVINNAPSTLAIGTPYSWILYKTATGGARWVRS